MDVSFPPSVRSADRPRRHNRKQKSLLCHSRAGGNPEARTLKWNTDQTITNRSCGLFDLSPHLYLWSWIPAFAGMTLLLHVHNLLRRNDTRVLRFVDFMALFAKKSLGQHFLNSKHVLGQIITASNIAKGENVLEIGPGTGALTRPLLDAGAKVVAVEKDDRAIDFLKGIFTTECESGQLTVVHGDILELRSQNSDNSDQKTIISSPYAVIANIPYYITGSILQSFLEFTPRPTRMVLLVQKEVAERIVARDSKESILAISVKAFCDAKIIANVPRGAFTPPPNVDSAILSLENVTDERFVQNNVEISKFFKILKAGFAHKRKYLKRNIEEIMSDEEKIILSNRWTELNLDEKVRAEDLELDTWFKLAK